VKQNQNPEKPSISLASENGNSIAEFSVFGGSVTNLSLFEKTIIPRPGIEDPVSAVFGSILAPWPNRLADGCFDLDGVQYRFEPLDKDSNRNHGLLLRTPLHFQKTESEISFHHRFSPADYGFEIDFQFGYRLTETGFEGWASAENLGEGPAPFAVGFHPYFRIPGVSKLTANVTKAFQTDSRMLPVSETQIEGLEIALPKTTQLDNGFFGKGWTLRLVGEEFGFEITQQNLDHLMLYRPSPSLFEDGSEGIAIEPQSAPANAFNTELEQHLLKPGEKRSYSFQIRMLG
jgi:aldose 1-epimerase